MPFEEQLPEWNAAGVEPPASKKNTGWQAGEKPPADYWNWQMNRTYKALEELQQKAAEIADLNAHTAATTGVHGATSAATPNTLVQRDAAGRMKVAAPAAADDVARKDTVDNAIAALRGAAPGTLDTLAKLAQAINNDPNFAATINAALAGKLDKTGGTMTGDINSSAADFQIGKTVDTGRTIIKGGSSGSVANGANIHVEGIDYGGTGAGGNVRVNLPAGKNLLVNGNKTWHAGNDGAGSGLDADMLDGLHASSFLQTAGGTVSGALAVGGNLTANGGENRIKNLIVNGGYFEVESYGSQYGSGKLRTYFDANNRRWVLAANIGGTAYPLSIDLNGVLILSRTGSPEGSITAPVGSIYLRIDGSAGQTFYVKVSGTGNTGWQAVA